MARLSRRKAWSVGSRRRLGAALAEMTGLNAGIYFEEQEKNPMKTSFVAGLVLALLLLSPISVGLAQSPSPTPPLATPAPTPTPTPAPNDFALDLGASFTSVTSAPSVVGTNTMATRFTVRAPLTGRWSGRIEAIKLPSDQATVYLAGLEYDRFLSDFFHPKDVKFDPSKFQLFAYGGFGGKKQDISTTPAFSAIAGGGVRRVLGGNLVMEIVNVSYFRSDLSRPGVILSNNNLSVSSGIGFKF
jgi:hypothetical protein